MDQATKEYLDQRFDVYLNKDEFREFRKSFNEDLLALFGDIGKINRRLDRMDRRQSAVDRLLEKMDRRQATADRLLDKMDRRQSNTDRLFEKMDDRQGNSDRRQASLDRLVRKYDRLFDDHGRRITALEA